MFWKVPDKPPDRKFIVLAHSNIDSNVRTTIELRPNFLSLEEPTMSLVKIIVITVLIILSILLFGRFLF